MKHTQGTWQLGKRGASVVSDIIDSDVKDFSLYGGQLIAESIGNKADAKLIAAAPDLLKAIEYLVGVNTKDRLKCELPEAIEKAKAAIKKATE